MAGVSPQGGFARQVWRYGRWVLLALLAGYVALLAWRVPALEQQQKSAEAVAFIKSQRLTLADVDGSRLPPKPDPKLADATVEGVDANENGIRDDVELAIFAKYPNSPYTRAAALQYAMELQLELSQVFDSPTLIAVIQLEDRGYQCLRTDADRDAVENLIFNTSERKNERENIYKKYMTSFGLPSDETVCDISSL